MNSQRQSVRRAEPRPAARISVVVPVYANATTLRELHRRLVEALQDVDRRELIFVNDGCEAGSGEVLRELADADDSVVVIDLPVNRGQNAAVLAGLARSHGEWTVVLDADLQDPPEAIPLLLAAASPEIGAVFAGRRGSYQSRTRLLTGRIYRRLLRLVAGTPSDAGAFVALNRLTVARLLEMNAATSGRTPALVAMIGCAGLETSSVPVERDSRSGGSSAYSAARRVRSALHALTWAAAWKLRGRSNTAAGATADRDEGRSSAPIDIQSHNAYQRHYFEQVAKPTMVPRNTRYLTRHVDELLSATRIGPGDRVLEVGCGMGRYTLLLADRGIHVEGLDLSPRLLERLAEFNAGRHEIPLHPADVLDPPPELFGGFDAVVGLFALHHMHDLAASLASAARLLRPGGRVAFCEPNPYNPLYYVQIALQPGMTWDGDGGLVRIRRRPITRHLEAAGFSDLFWKQFGFFPPFLTNGPLSAAERPLEAFPLWRSALPFQLFGGRLVEE